VGDSSLNHQLDAPVGARRGGEAEPAVNRHRQGQPVVPLRVAAEQLDARGSLHQMRRRVAEGLLEERPRRARRVARRLPAAEGGLHVRGSLPD
jgi:hypothetical protein